jgi:hypothetical protein
MRTIELDCNSLSGIDKQDRKPRYTWQTLPVSYVFPHVVWIVVLHGSLGAAGIIICPRLKVLVPLKKET